MSTLELKVIGGLDLGGQFTINGNTFTINSFRSQKNDVVKVLGDQDQADEIVSTLRNDLLPLLDFSIQQTTNTITLSFNGEIVFNTDLINLESILINEPVTEDFKIISQSIENISDTLYGLTLVFNKTLFNGTFIVFGDRFPSNIFSDTNGLPFDTTNISKDTIDVVLRKNDSYSLGVNDIDGGFISETFLKTPKLNADNIEFKSLRVQGGYNVTFSYNGDSLPIEWSLDGSDYQDSNLFFNQLEGVHTVSVRDSFGEIVTKQIELFNQSTEPYFLYSQLNSVRAVKQEAIDNVKVHRNISNTLSYQETQKSKKCYTYDFLSTDRSKIQIKTNYGNVTVKTIGGLEANLTVEKKTSNTGQKVAIESNVSVIDGKTYISFLSGSILDYNDTNTILEPYVLNGNLPFWAEVGSIIEVNGNEFIVSEVLFDPIVRTNFLIINVDVGLTGSNVVIKSMYNLQPYEVYEFYLPLSSYPLNSIFQVEILLQDSRFEDATLLTEKIRVNDYLESHLFLIWRDTKNNDVNYSTGIYHSCRLPYQTKSHNTNQSQQVFDSDTNSFLINSENINNVSIEFDFLTTGVAQNLLYALSSRELFVNGIGYVKDEAFEIEGAFDESNIYKIVAKLKETGFTFDLIDFESNTPLSFTAFDVPLLEPASPIRIDTGSGLLVDESTFFKSLESLMCRCCSVV